MFVRRAAFCGVIAIAALAVLHLSSAHAGDTTTANEPPFHPSEREMALARAFVQGNARTYNPPAPEGEELERQADDLLYVCTRIPEARLPRGILHSCEDFDHFKEVFAQFPSGSEHTKQGDRCPPGARCSIEGDTKEAVPPHVKQTVVPRHDPGAIDLCPPPHKMTRDGCQ
jgi:hypothetical protein